jgi:hypothetical protein
VAALERVITPTLARQRPPLAAQAPSAVAARLLGRKAA